MNVVWLLFGGVFVALQYYVAGAVLMLTVVGIPFGAQAMKLGQFAISPFGKAAIDTGSGGGTAFMNMLWILIGGIWIALSHLLSGLMLCCTIIFIPLGKQHFKMMGLALAPFGKQIVDEKSLKGSQAATIVINVGR